MKLSISHILLILRWATVCVFFGRGWLHLIWEVPYGSLLYEESWMTGIAHALGYSWHQWETDASISSVLKAFKIAIGVVYMLLAILAAFLKKHHPKQVGKLLWLGAGLLFFLAFVSFKSHNYIWPQWWEHSLQFSIPVFFYLALFHPPAHTYSLWIKIAIALTFTCHGLYALGFPYETPANFWAMTMSILPLNEELARIFLTIAGGLDVLVSVLIFFPRTARPALMYAVIWGSLTALARVVAYTDLDQTHLDLLRWLPETILRVPHAVVPLAVWLMYPPKESMDEQQAESLESQS